MLCFFLNLRVVCCQVCDLFYRRFVHFPDIFTILVVSALSLSGALAGVYVSKGRRWAMWFGGALCLFTVMLLLSRWSALHYRLAYAWWGRGRFDSVLFAVCLPLMFGAIIPRLAGGRQRLMVGVLAVIGTGYFGLLPFVEFALVRGRLAGLETWRENGICLQTTDFTCGPAAAVSALGQLGVQAEESDLAIAAYATPSMGSSLGQLAYAIESLYGDQGIRCGVKRFTSVEQLDGQCPVIVVVKHRFMADHFVAVLSVEDDVVTIADPLKGLERRDAKLFCRQWRFVCICVQPP